MVTIHSAIIIINVNYTNHVQEILFLPFCFTDEARAKKCSVLVHCLAGVSRSVTVTVAYLMQKCHLSLNDAYDYVKKCKPNISPNFNFMGQLLDFERILSASPEKCKCAADNCSCKEYKTYFMAVNKSPRTFTLGAVPS